MAVSVSGESPLEQKKGLLWGCGCFSADVLGSLQMAQEGTWKGASRAGPLSELVLLRPVPWDPKMYVKAELFAVGAARKRGRECP